MNYTETEYNAIWDYLEDNLNEAERSKVEQRIKDDREFRIEVESCRSVLNNLHYMEGRKFVSELNLQTESKPKFEVFKNQKFLRIAAGIILISTIGLFLYYANKGAETPLAKSEIVIEDTEVVKPEFSALSFKDLVKNNLSLPVESESDKFDRAVNEINNGRINQAIEDLLALSKTAKTEEIKEDSDILFGASGENKKPVASQNLTQIEKQYQHLYLAIAHLKNENYDDALKSLSNVKDENLSDQVLWYKSLALLGIGEKAGAMENLKKLVDFEDSRLKGQAELLIQELQK